MIAAARLSIRRHHHYSPVANKYGTEVPTSRAFNPKNEGRVVQMLLHPAASF
jgi:hypothetical protein